MLPFIHLTLAQFIEAAGYAGIFGMIFAESGLPFGFIFPGDSLLFTAGLLAATHLLSIVPLIAVAILAAIAGDSVGYWLGVRTGPLLFVKEDSFFFSTRHLHRAQEFYARHGGRALILARFIPAVRTFTPILAGVARMPYKAFLPYNLIGGVLWGGGITLAGYFLGKTIPGSEHYLSLIIMGIIVLSFVPIVFEYLKHRMRVRS